MVHWSCSSSLCVNNWATITEHGEKLKYFKLPKDPIIQAKYQKIFKTDGFNWKRGYICGAHWKDGVRTSPNHLPEIAVPARQLECLREKLDRAQKAFDSATRPTKTITTRLTKYKKKLQTALSIIKEEEKKKTPRKLVVRASPIKAVRKRELSKTQLKKRLEKSYGKNEELEAKLEKANSKIKQLESLVEIKDRILKEKLQDHSKLLSEHYDLKLQSFSYTNLRQHAKNFEYLCGLDVEKFDILMKCLEPYVHLIPYPESKVMEKTMTFATQLLATLTICRHGLDFRFMAYMSRTSSTTISRIFNGWVVFISTILSEINLKPGHGFLLQKMPDIFIKTGHGMTDIVIDATEFKFQTASNYELNSLMFSNYKNTATGKALIGIAPHGMGLLFSDIYPGSISDSVITEKSGTLMMVEEEHEVMSDRGFAIHELCAIKGVFLNRPKQKDSDQFKEADVQKNFDIAATRIHVERYIGRVRDWTILNRVWPLNMMNILSSTWQSICHIVNLTLPPIGPKHL